MNKLMGHIICMLLCIMLLCAGMTVAASAERIDLIVFAPPSMGKAMMELRDIYEAEHPETYIFYNFESTNSQMIEVSGECDVFISSTPKQMDQLDKEADPAVNTAGNDLVLQGTRINLLENKVVLAVPEDNPKGIESYDALAQGLKDGTIRLGVVPGSSVIGQYTEEILALYGLDEIKLEEKGIVTYGMGVQAVISLISEGEVDFNVEQHTAYMENFNNKQGGHLAALTPIPTVPAGIYPGAKNALDDISDGAKVAVPNDTSNTARAYALLQKAGWIKLDPNKNLSTVTQQDIIENPHHIQFTEMKSLNIPAVREDFDFIVITGSIVYNAKIDPSTALLTEDILPHLLLQLVVNEKDKDSQWAKDIVAAYHSEEFAEYMKKNNNGLWYVPEVK